MLLKPGITGWFNPPIPAPKTDCQAGWQWVAFLQAFLWPSTEMNPTASQLIITFIQVPSSKANYYGWHTPVRNGTFTTTNKLIQQSESKVINACVFLFFFFSSEPDAISSSSSCECSDEAFNPVCGSDGVEFRSPCHAGCLTMETDSNQKTLVWAMSININKTNSKKVKEFI